MLKYINIFNIFWYVLTKLIKTNLILGGFAPQTPWIWGASHPRPPDNYEGAPPPQTPHFMKTKKYRIEIPYTGAKPERLDLCYVSENEGFRFSPNTHSGGRRRRKKKNFPKTSTPLSHRTQGWNIPFGHPPHFDKEYDEIRDFCMC